MPQSQWKEVKKWEEEKDRVEETGKETKKKIKIDFYILFSFEVKRDQAFKKIKVY